MTPVRGVTVGALIGGATLVLALPGLLSGRTVGADDAAAAAT